MIAICSLLLAASSLVSASICPQENHTVCNSEHSHHACVCSMSLKQEAPPEKSCNTLLEIGGNFFPAASVVFNLDESAGHHDEFDEEKFREAVATSLRLDEDDIIVLRVRCVEDDKKLAIQFVVLKDKKKTKAAKKSVKKTKSEEEDEDGDEVDDKNHNDDDENDEEEQDEKKEKTGKDAKSKDDNDDDGNADNGAEDDDVSREADGTPKKYDIEDMIKAADIVNRMKGIGHLSQLAGLDVDKIEFVEEMFAIEGAQDNSVLIMQAAIAGAAFTLMCILGVWRGLKKREENNYESVMQKA